MCDPPAVLLLRKRPRSSNRLTSLFFLCYFRVTTCWDRAVTTFAMSSSGVLPVYAESDSLLRGTPKVRRTYQFKALIRKNIKLQLRAPCTLCCMIAVPMLIVLFAGGMVLTGTWLLLGSRRRRNQ